MDYLKKELIRIEKGYTDETYTTRTIKFFQNSFWKEVQKQNVEFFVGISQNLYEITSIEEYREVSDERDVLVLLDNIIDDVIDSIMNSEDYIDFEEVGDDFYVVLQNVGLY